MTLAISNYLNGETMDSKKTLVLSCMDRRLNDYLDEKYNDGNTLFLRNAGANVNTLLNTIKQLAIEFPVKKIIIAPHTDCGAMGLVSSTIASGSNAHELVEKALVSQFRARKFSDRADLESRVNGEVQKEAIVAFANAIGAELSVELVNLNGLNIPADSGRHVLTIAKPSSTSYSDFLKRYDDKVGHFESYFIQSRSLRDVLPDIHVAATALHIRDVRLISENSRDNLLLPNQVKLLKEQEWMKDADISKVSHVQKRSRIVN